tara:strand:- start:401 stop:547 length:147 start_codon:yes stop_codon:yes gene_type:complete
MWSICVTADRAPTRDGDAPPAPSAIRHPPSNATGIAKLTHNGDAAREL